MWSVPRMMLAELLTSSARATIPCHSTSKLQMLAYLTTDSCNGRCHSAAQRRRTCRSLVASGVRSATTLSASTCHRRHSVTEICSIFSGVSPWRTSTTLPSRVYWIVRSQPVVSPLAHDRRASGSMRTVVSPSDLYERSNDPSALSAVRRSLIRPHSLCLAYAAPAIYRSAILQALCVLDVAGRC